MNKCKDCERETACKIRKGSHKYCFKPKKGEKKNETYSKQAHRTLEFGYRIF